MFSQLTKCCASSYLLRIFFSANKHSLLSILKDVVQGNLLNRGTLTYIIYGMTEESEKLVYSRNIQSLKMREKNIQY
jgi:hypothetical protein